jgi:hypothetical protein
MNIYSRVKWPQVFDVPSIGDDLIILLLDLERSGSKYLIDDERSLPRGCKLESILAALNLSED